MFVEELRERRSQADGGCAAVLFRFLVFFFFLFFLRHPFSLSLLVDVIFLL